MTHRRIWSAGTWIAAALAAAAAFLTGCAPEPPPGAALAPSEVVVRTLSPVDVALRPSFVGQVKSSHEVEIIARVSGFLDRIAYREGQKVKAGEVLFQIDKKPFETQLDALKAQVDSLKAEAWTAKANLDRIRPLAKLDAASKSDLDNATGRYMSAQAAVAQAQAQMQKAKLELGYTTITSPIDGVTGEALVREGTYLAAAGAQSKLTHVVQLDPIWVEFSVTQNQYAAMQSEISSGRVFSPEIGQYQIEIEFADGGRYGHTGRFDFAERSLNRQTGTFLVRAELPNPDESLLPGMYVRVFVLGAKRPNALLVPQKAVQQTANGHVVYVANAKDQAEIRPVVVGDWVGQDWIINQGVKAGERVIVEGFQRLAPGAPLKIAAAASSSKAAPAAGGR